MFLFKAGTYLDELRRLRPEMADACHRAVERGRMDLDFFRLDAEAFAAAPSDSIDYAVMEHTARAAMVPLDAGWNDVGAWSSLWDMGKKDGRGNVVLGPATLDAASGSYIRSEGPVVAAVGIENLVIVATEDAVLVAGKDQAQNIKGAVEALRRQGRTEADSSPVVYRPWGSYRTIDTGAGFLVKRLTVKPRASLSLQRHAHRAEHWVVVSGTAEVTRGTETFRLQPNESTYIPLGTVHRLANPGDQPLHLIEVQSGALLSEDDIERLEDRYGRS
jgi:mannose-1-phosphate guanylyltransferase/mannose-6-phosphate isomerase